MPICHRCEPCTRRCHPAPPRSPPSRRRWFRNSSSTTAAAAPRLHLPLGASRCTCSRWRPTVGCPRTSRSLLSQHAQNP
eukprot:1295281-Heterocapsa_arctica.AAC.1